MKIKEEILTFEKVANLLNISSNRLTRLIKKGLPCVSLGYESKIFLKNEVIEWLRNSDK